MRRKSINVYDNKGKTKEEKINKSSVIKKDYGLNPNPPLLLKPHQMLRKVPDFWTDQANP